MGEVGKSLTLRASGFPLQGTVRVQGSKHGFAHVLAVAAMSDEGTLFGVPRIRDSEALIECLGYVFEKVKWSIDGTLRFSSPVNPGVLHLEDRLIKKSRNIYCVLPALLARSDEVIMHGRPQGCRFQERPDDWYFGTLRAFGVEITRPSPAIISMRWAVKAAANLSFSFPSMTGSVIAIALAAVCKGSSVLNGLSSEPSVRDALEVIQDGGCAVDSAGRNSTITSLGSMSTSVAHIRPDQEAAVTIMCAVAIAGGAVKLVAEKPLQMSRFTQALRASGLETTESGTELQLEVEPGRALSPTKIIAGAHPYFSSDWAPMALLTLALRSSGESCLIDTMFPDRFGFLAALLPMGLNNVSLACTKTRGRIAVRAAIGGRGNFTLDGGAVEKTQDLRASASIVLASLAATSELRLGNDLHLRRGYEDLPGVLHSLGGLDYVVGECREEN